MHTTMSNKTIFIHNGDFSGPVDIKTPEGVLSVPFNDLRHLVAEYVRARKIGDLEDADDDKMLGL